jgi:methylmalonyl-CoA mutase cobalamin-binding domain/chain
MRTRPTFGGGPTELHSSIFALPCKLPPNRPNGRKIDVMPAKSGLGGHDRASGTSSALRGPGMKPACAAFIRLMSRSLKYEQVAEMPIQEAAAIALQSSRCHSDPGPAGRGPADRTGVDDVLIAARRHDPRRRHSELKQLCVVEVFTPGASANDIASFVRGGRHRAPSGQTH